MFPGQFIGDMVSHFTGPNNNDFQTILTFRKPKLFPAPVLSTESPAIYTKENDRAQAGGRSSPLTRIRTDKTRLILSENTTGRRFTFRVDQIHNFSAL